MKRIMLAIGGLPFLRIFRNNVGTGWQGASVRQWKENGHSYMLLKDPRPLHAGLCVGSSDLIGWRIVEVTPEMVGKHVAVFTAIEIKTETGRPTKEQSNFLQVVQMSGGIAGIARSEHEAINMVQGGL